MPAGLQIRWVLPAGQQKKSVLPAGQQKKSVLPAGQDVAASCDITASEATLPSCFLHELYTGFALRQFENPFRQKGPICPGGILVVPSMLRHFQQHATTRANGFSLFELLIVMTIIVTITAMAAPNMMERVRNGRVQEAAEDVREVMAFARQQAIDSGVDYHVRFEVNGQAVVAIPAEPQPTLVNQAGSNSSRSEVLVMSLVLEPEKMFLRTVKGDYAGGEQLEPAAFANLDGNDNFSNRSWSTPILFRFDGSAEDRTFRVMDEENRTSEISVRGLTGAIKVAPVFMMEAD